MRHYLNLRAYAKINLDLRVFGRAPTGYHPIRSIMQSISLSDEVKIAPTVEGTKVTCDDPGVPTGRHNLAFEAAEAFRHYRGQPFGIKIFIKKRIPVAAGLAGGSADAAAVLVGLNRLFKTRLSLKELQRLGAEIGADVPFCLVGGRALCRGKGEIVIPRKPPKKTWLVLVKPKFSISTAWAYGEWDKSRVKGQGSRVKNDLEPVVAHKYPEIQKIKEKLLRAGATAAAMSGSGPTVFGIAPNKTAAGRLYRALKKVYPRSYLVHTVNRGIAFR